MSNVAVTLEGKNSEVPVRHHRAPVIIFTHTPKPIHVEVENFQTLVQRLTGGTRKRKSVEKAPSRSKEPSKSRALQDYLERLDQESAPPSKSRALQEYLENLDRECAPPRLPPNRGFFATAGLVEGVKIEDGLQFGGDSNLRGSSALDSGTTEDESEISNGGYAQDYSLDSLTSAMILSPDWTEGPGCLSPRSYQIVKHAKRTAAHRHLSGSGPWRVSPDVMQDTMQVPNPWNVNDEWDPQVDRLYFGGEVTLVDDAQHS